ncbi:MAG: hypothetical protein RIR26_384 [Pseudomonadota bacterium]|jgi:hypothetical protein
MNFDPLKNQYDRFCFMAGRLALVELKLRLLLDKHDLNARRKNSPKFLDDFGSIIDLAIKTYDFTEEEGQLFNDVRNLRNALLHGNSTQAGQILKKKLPPSAEFEHGILIRADQEEPESFDPERTDQGLLSHLFVLVSDEYLKSVVETADRATAGILRVALETAQGPCG